MTTSNGMAQLSSPLITRRKGGVLTATDADGGLVLEGRADGGDPLVCTTAGGQWRVHKMVKTDSGRSNLVTDASNREVARIEQHAFKKWRVILPSGESIPISKGQLRLNYASKFGDLGTAKAPYFRPRRYIQFTLADGLLTRVDRDAVAVAIIWATRVMIANAMEGDRFTNIG